VTPLNPSTRKPFELRPLSIDLDVNRYAEGSALIKMGETHVLCTVSIEESVPGWLKGQGQGWVTGEYSMLPRATHTRSRRERDKVSGRTQEIQRLIGRALRSIVNLKALGERTVTVDCDVLQADGGTRTASINGGCVALMSALEKYFKAGKLSSNPITGSVAAISLGLKSNNVYVDLDYELDSTCDVDMNFVVTDKNEFVEIQGTAERAAFSKTHLDLLTEQALAACQQVRAFQIKTLEKQAAKD